MNPRLSLVSHVHAQYSHFLFVSISLVALYLLIKIIFFAAPMPGTVKSVSVEVGQMIGEGAECCVLEAMKMQNSLKIGSTGKVKAVHVKPGATVQADDVLVELE